MKRVLKVLAPGVIPGVALGLVLGLLRTNLNIDQVTFLKWFWIFTLPILVGAMLFNILYNLYYHHKVKSLATQLEEGHPQVFVEGMEQLLRTAKGRRLREILTLNLTAGYIETQQFDRAIAILEEMGQKQRQNSAMAVTRCINLYTSYFKTEQYKKALELYQSQQPLLDSFRRHSIYGPHIAVVDVMAALIQEDYPQAEALLHAAAQTKTTPRIQATLDRLSHTIEAMKAGQAPSTEPPA